MQHVLQNLADINYIVFCSCLQFVLMVMFASIRTWTHSSLPHMLVLMQLQAYGVLFAGHVVWLLIAPASLGVKKSDDKEEDVEMDETGSHENTEVADEMPPDMVQDISEKNDRTLFGSPASIVDSEDSDSNNALDMHWCMLDLSSFLNDTAVHIAAVYMVYTIGGLLLGVAGCLSCGTEPAERLCQLTWHSDEGLWIGIAYSLIQLSVAVTSVVMYKRKEKERGAPPVNDIMHIMLLYSLLSWLTQNIIDRYNRIYNKELCSTKYKGSHELRVYSYIYIVISATIIFVSSCSFKTQELSNKMKSNSLSFLVSTRIILPLAFVFSLTTIGLMYKSHSDTHRFDAILLTYMGSIFFLCTSFIRSSWRGVFDVSDK